MPEPVVENETLPAVERPCAHHPAWEAVAICSLCGQDICARCHATSLTGYVVCAHCPVREKLRPKAAIEARDLSNPVVAGIRTAVAILRSPRAFFSHIPLSREWYRPFIFGYLCLLIGAFFATLWQVLFVGEFGEVISSIAEQWALSESGLRVLLFGALPPATFLLLGMHAVLLYATLQLFGATSARFEHVVRLVGFAAAAHLFLIIPPVLGFPVGHFLAIVWVLNIEVIAVQRYFELNFIRALGVVFVPYLMTPFFFGI